MKLLVVTHAPLKWEDEKWKGYAPYIDEMDIWMKYVSSTTFICPTNTHNETLGRALKDQNFNIVHVPEFSLIGLKNILKAPFSVMVCLYRIYIEMLKADHIHLRCPGNIGLLGCILQILFPFKRKTAKYAGNWDSTSKQPISYRFQKWILNSIFLSKKMSVMVYGNWPDSSRNVVPFFTATYSASQIQPLEIRSLKEQPIRLIFAGSLVEGKRPLLSCQVAAELKLKGFNVILDVFGDGKLKDKIEQYVLDNNLQDVIKIHGSRPKGEVIEYYKKAHFLLFFSKTEGWAKVVVEAMWWGCLPIVSPGACLPELIGHQERGSIIEPEINVIVAEVIKYLTEMNIYETKLKNAINYANQFTLERFEQKISDLIQSKKF